MPDQPGLFAELKRRNVLRAAVLYVAAVWALSQGVSQLSPALGLPDVATRWFLIACAIGFPLWIAFAWFYEFTPQGFRRDEEVAMDVPLRRSNARRLDLAIIGVLAIAVALLAAGYFVRRRAPAQAGATAASAASDFNPPAGSLVVLPFTDLNGDPRQRYFSDGITEELTNALGQNTALRVIAWDTASKYRDAGHGLTAIGRELNVANVLTGKILRQGGEVRLIVELVNARTGFQVWSNHYDDSLANVFQVQDRFSADIAAALKVKFANLGAARPVNPEAHDLALKAWALINVARTAAQLEEARTLLTRATALDPGYADAHAWLARAWLDLTQFATLPLKDVLPKVRSEAHAALALDPRNVDALIALASADASEGKVAAAKARYERALEIDPSNAVAHLDYGNVLPLQAGLGQYREAALLDPDNASAQNNLAAQYLDLGQYEEALAPAQALLRLDPHSADNVLGLAEPYVLLHRDADAVKAFDDARPNTPLAGAIVAAGRLAYQSRIDPAVRGRALAAVDALRHRADLDPTSMLDVLQLELALGQNDVALELLPKVCADQPVGCGDLSLNPMWIPLRGQPRFAALVAQYDTISKPAASSDAPAASAAASTVRP